MRKNTHCSMELGMKVDVKHTAMVDDLTSLVHKQGTSAASP